MDVVTTSLETLLQRATNPQNMKPDLAGIEAFCALVNKETDGAPIGVRLIALRIQAPHEREALQALNVLDTCMKKCGQAFHAEIGKFRFLNEMIKLVSPKYLGNRTTISVRNKVLNLMHAWIKDYPREAKIKEAFEMLKKQGVVNDSTFASPIEHVSQPTEDNVKSKNSTIFQDEEKSKLLQKLLRSKNPDDLQAANRLIKTMVREDERRVELISRRSSELQTVHNNARLLSEMLDSYRPDQVSAGEIELIRELYQSCERLRPAVYRLASETQHSEEMLNEVIEASVALGEVFEKYKTVIAHGNVVNENVSTDELTKLENADTNVDSLLDLTSPSENLASTLQNIHTHTSNPLKSDLDALGDIFNSIESNCNQRLDDADVLPHTILQPINVAQNTCMDNSTTTDERVMSKTKAFEELDVLGETLLQESLTGSCRLGAHFKKPIDKIPMNMISKLSLDNNNTKKKTNSSEIADSPGNFDLNFLASENTGLKARNLSNGDDSILNLSDESTILKSISNNIVTTVSDSSTSESMTSPRIMTGSDQLQTKYNKDHKLLADVFVPLESIKPGTIPPLTVLDDKSGVTVILHFAKNVPHENIFVIVISTISKNSLPLTNYLFQAIVPKACKIKLQPPSASELPAHNPFLPAAAITQVLLIANPQCQPISLKFMISYTIDGETVTEMGEVDALPLNEIM